MQRGAAGRLAVLSDRTEPDPNLTRAGGDVAGDAGASVPAAFGCSIALSRRRDLRWSLGGLQSLILRGRAKDLERRDVQEARDVRGQTTLFGDLHRGQAGRAAVPHFSESAESADGAFNLLPVLTSSGRTVGPRFGSPADSASGDTGT